MNKTRSAKQLGNAIQSYRLNMGLTQQQLADLSGTGQKTISKIENGNPSTRIDTVFSIMAALGLEAHIKPRISNDTYGFNKDIADLL